MAEQRRTVEEYIGSFPDDVQRILTEIRRRILHVVPAAGATIGYQIPTITLDGKHLVYFGAWKNHIALYPVPADETLRAELAPYLAGKSTIRFALRNPIPYDLIERMVLQLVLERG